MPPLIWDQVGEKLYETGVDHGVLYLPDAAGVYNSGFAWNGLTTVTESPSGAEASPQYADNIKYLNMISAEEFGVNYRGIHVSRRVRSVRWYGSSGTGCGRWTAGSEDVRPEL